jgi:uncharacterized protein
VYHYLVMTIRTPQFQPGVIEPHMAFLAELREQGRIVLAGAFTDKSGGAYLMKASDLAEAQAIAFRDPVHTTGFSVVTVHEWNAK